MAPFSKVQKFMDTTSGLSYLKREKLVNYDSIRRNRDVVNFK